MTAMIRGRSCQVLYSRRPRHGVVFFHGTSRDMKILDPGLALLAQKEPASICRGAELLAQTGQPEAIDALLPMLGSRSEAVKDCVRRALDSMDVAPLLLGWWRGPDVEKRAQALSYAVALSHAGLMELYREAAYDDMAGLRKQVGIGLKRQKPTPEALHLLGMLAADSDKDVRWWAIDSLVILDTPETLTILEERLADEADENVKPFIEKALRLAQPR